jgi:hypothetical protein
MAKCHNQPNFTRLKLLIEVNQPLRIGDIYLRDTRWQPRPHPHPHHHWQHPMGTPQHKSVEALRNKLQGPLSTLTIVKQYTSPGRGRESKAPNPEGKSSDSQYLILNILAFRNLLLRAK